MIAGHEIKCLVDRLSAVVDGVSDFVGGNLGLFFERDTWDEQKRM